MIPPLLVGLNWKSDLMRIPPIWSVGNITDKFYIIIMDIYKLEIINMDPLTPSILFLF